MTLRTILAALLMLIPAAQAQPPGPGTVKASDAFIDCLVKAARKLDKGNSAPSAVGKSIQALCVAEQRRWEQAQTENYSAEKRSAFLEGMKVQTDAIAVQIVTEQRKFKALMH